MISSIIVKFWLVTLFPLLNTKIGQNIVESLSSNAHFDQFCVFGLCVVFRFLGPIALGPHLFVRQERMKWKIPSLALFCQSQNPASQFPFWIPLPTELPSSSAQKSSHPKSTTRRVRYLELPDFNVNSFGLLRCLQECNSSLGFLNLSRRGNAQKQLSSVQTEPRD